MHTVYHSFKINFNIILSPMPRSSTQFVPSSIPNKMVFALVLSTMRATCHAGLFLLHFIGINIWRVYHKLLPHVHVEATPDCRYKKWKDPPLLP